MNEVTGVVVCSNTKELLQRAYESVRSFHPDMKIIIIDGSKATDPCYHYVCSLASEITTVGIYNYNIGHGNGMNAGIHLVRTKFALVFDSDIVMLKSPVEDMLRLMNEDTYGVGAFDYVDDRGFGKHNHSQEWRDAATKYLHPFFQLINVANYFGFPPYVHHGSPCYKAMNEIKRQGLSDRILIEFPGLSIVNQEGEPGGFIVHQAAGTRNDRRRRGLVDIEGRWDRGGKILRRNLL